MLSAIGFSKPAIIEQVGKKPPISLRLVSVKNKLPSRFTAEPFGITNDFKNLTLVFYSVKYAQKTGIV